MEVTAIIAIVNVTSAEQASSIGQVNVAIADMNAVSQQNAELVE